MNNKKIFIGLILVIATLCFVIYLQNKNIDTLKMEVKYKEVIITKLEENNKMLQNYLFNKNN